MRPTKPQVPHLLRVSAPRGFIASRFSFMVAITIALLSVGCCSHVDHKKLATFPTIRKSFEGAKSNLEFLKVDPKHEELKALAIEECQAGIDLCKQAEAR